MTTTQESQSVTVLEDFSDLAMALYPQTTQQKPTVKHKTVCMMNSEGEVINLWASLSACAKALEVSRAYVRKSLSGGRLDTPYFNFTNEDVYLTTEASDTEILRYCNFNKNPHRVNRPKLPPKVHSVGVTVYTLEEDGTYSRELYSNPSAVSDNYMPTTAQIISICNGKESYTEDVTFGWTINSLDSMDMMLNKLHSNL